MTTKAKLQRLFTYFVCFTICCFLYGLCHELIGHGLTAILLDGTIDSIHLFGFEVFPNFEWSGILGALGIGDIPTGKRMDIVIIMGPISTWVVSLLAVSALWICRPKGLFRVVLVCLSFWSYDLLGEVLTVWGIPKFLVFYSRPPQHYQAAVRLGIQDPLFYIFCIAMPVLIVSGVVYRLIYDQRKVGTGK